MIGDVVMGFPWWLCLQCRRSRFNPRVRKDLLEDEEMATHSNILAWRIPWTEPAGLQSMGHKEVDTTQLLGTHTLL